MVTLSVIAAIDLGLFGWYLKATIIRQPFWDMYSWILHYLDYRTTGGWWAYVWASHDVHRPVFIRLLTAFDIEAFGGVSYPFIAVTTAGHLVTAWLIWRESRAGMRGEAGWMLGCVALMLTLTSVAAVDCAIPLDNGYLHVLMLAVLAIVLFDGTEGVGTSGGSLVHWRRAAALLAACAAPLASAVGWAIWPILCWVAWRGGSGRRWTAAVAAAGVVFGTVYLRGLNVGFESGTVPDLADSLIKRADYLIVYLGLPWTRAAALAVPGRILGVVLLGAGVWAVLWKGVVRPAGGRLERLAVAFVMFSLASALMAAIGRADVPVDDGVVVPVRYSVLLTPLHVGLLWIASPVLARLWGRTPAVRAVLAGVGVLLLVQQVGVGQAAVATTRHMRATIERFEAGLTEPDMASVVYVDLDQARRELDIIRGAGLYVDLK